MGKRHTNKTGSSLLRSPIGHRISLCGKIDSIKSTTEYVRKLNKFPCGDETKNRQRYQKAQCLFAWWTGQVFPVTMGYISFNGSHSHNWESFKLIWHQTDRWLNSMDQCDNKTRAPPPKKLNQPPEWLHSKYWSTFSIYWSHCYRGRHLSAPVCNRSECGDIFQPVMMLRARAPYPVEQQELEGDVMRQKVGA